MAESILTTSLQGTGCTVGADFTAKHLQRKQPLLPPYQNKPDHAIIGALGPQLQVQYNWGVLHANCDIQLVVPCSHAVKDHGSLPRLPSCSQHLEAQMPRITIYTNTVTGVDHEFKYAHIMSIEQ